LPAFQQVTFCIIEVLKTEKSLLSLHFTFSFNFHADSYTYSVIGLQPIQFHIDIAISC